MASVRVLGVRVDGVDVAEALARIEGFMARPGRVRMVATVNPEFVMRARRDAAFRSALERADLCVPDGVGVVWAMRRLGCAGQRRVAGIDLVTALMERCAGRGWRPFLLGAQPGVAEAAARRLRERLPGLQVAGVHAGSPGTAGDPESLGRIRAARPDVLLVAYGHPAQELWIERNRDRLAVPVAIGVGGSLDFIAGRARRAPGWLRRAHLEWLWRLVREPWRARRMAVLPIYALAVLGDRR